MRRLVLAIVLAAAAQGAQAADLPFLRGSVTEGLRTSRPNWEGFYAGAQAGYGVANMNFGKTNNTLISSLVANPEITRNYSLPPWPRLGTSATRNSAFGGFVGYNGQWEDIVVGVDASFLHGTYRGSASGAYNNVYTSLGYLNTVTASSDATMTVKDFGSIRGRAGYAMGNFLPYVFAGVGLGQADIVRNVRVTASGTGGVAPLPPTYGPVIFPLSSNLGSHFVYGYSAGVGIDMMLFGNVFLRAEYEYLRITSAVDVGLNTVRAGIGYKF